MSTRTVYDCDNCAAEATAEPVGPFDFGSGPQSADLCLDCQIVFGIPHIMALATEYGVEPALPATVGGSAAKPKIASGKNDFTCPVCGYGGRLRGNVIIHMRDRHGMSAAEASKAVPPIGPSVKCEHCGYLASVNGLAQHISSAHAAA